MTKPDASPRSQPELEPLRLSGISHRRLGSLTNPIRSILWRLNVPYYEQLIRETERRHEEQLRGLWATQNEHLRQLETRLEPLVTRMASQLVGVQKDLLATSHRLASIEDTLPESHTQASVADRLETAVQELGVRLDGVVATTQTLSDWAAGLTAQLRALNARIARPDLGGGQQVEISSTDLGARGLTLVSGPSGRFIIRSQDLIGQTVLQHGVWEQHVRDAIERYSQPDKLAIDAGAYIGLHTVHLSRFFREVLAFEPQQPIFRMLCANLLLNNCENVRELSLALYDRDCAMTLGSADQQNVPVIMTSGKIDYSAIPNAAGLALHPRTDGEIPARTVDALNLDDVGFIKVDTQGSDLRVLRGAERTIRRCRPVIVFEYERDLARAHGCEWEEFQAFLGGIGYDVEVLHVLVPDRQIDYLAVPS